MTTFTTLGLGGLHEASTPGPTNLVVAATGLRAAATFYRPPGGSSRLDASTRG
jgi:hypothetical protein